MLALEAYRSRPRYAASALLARRAPGLVTAGLAPLRLVQAPAPARPGSGWARVRPRLAGICGSDLALLAGRGSAYFSALVSFPFTPGHEVVGDLLDDVGDLAAGSRVVLDPTLGCEARGLSACPACLAGARERCCRIVAGHLAPGLQTGYCADTGGGWGGVLLAHCSQLHPVPDDLPDHAAVLLEPLACAVHAVRRGLIGSTEAPASVLVVGAGTLGLLTVFVLRRLTSVGHILAVARHPRQRERALALGASAAVHPDAAIGAVRRLTRAHRLEPEWGEPYLLGGVDLAFDCAGTAAALDLALRTTRAGGRVVLIGLPTAGVDLAPLWFRELELVGAYAASSGFPEAVALARQTPLPADLLSAVYSLASWREAIDHALDGGRLGAVKVAFDPRLG
jgi:threonine dehydrogenase-like Zn-dependent dehydrogenase